MALRFLTVLILVALSGCADVRLDLHGLQTPLGGVLGLRRDQPNGPWRPYVGTPIDFTPVGYPQYFRKTGE